MGVGDHRARRWAVVQSLDELASLARTAGAIVVERFLQMRERLHAATFLGRGKAEELGHIARQHDVDLVIIDADLSAAQVRNLEQILNVRVIDRTTLILDIFALHARTREAKLQVELAQLQYRLPRLVGHRTELSRLGGGIGTRGPGEKKLEVDRRRIKERILTVRHGLRKIERSKVVQRRGRSLMPRVAVVGYTNAGKSSLVNALTRAQLFTSEQLFSTLDSNTSQLFVSPGRKVLISDTVGFLKHLPHDLIASFRATLAEVIDAQLLLHVIDATSPDIDERLATVQQVLDDIGASGKPAILVFNKCDRLFPEDRVRLSERFPEAGFISATRRTGLQELRQHLVRHFWPGA